MYQVSTLQSFYKLERSRDQYHRSLDFSTDDLLPQEQFQAFRSAFQGVMDLSCQAREREPFAASQKVWNLDCLAFMRTELPGKDRPHRRKHLKKSVLDHWYIDLPFRALNGGNFSEEGAAFPELHCLGTPFDTQIDVDGIVTLFIPHDLFTSSTNLYRMLDFRIDGGMGKLLADYLFILNRSLEELRATEMPNIVAATRSIVAACLSPSQDRLTEAKSPIDATLLARARRLIDSRLTDHELSPEMLCASLGTSRSRLYRLFEPLGGVASYIRKRRLLRTRDALSDIADGRSIARIAEQWGFLDASAYSRTFRNEFGISPKEARDIAWASDGLVIARESHLRADQPSTLYELLRIVSGG
ncbi:MAG: helix-turn-helix domain-containing protein [Rhizobiaceae bacterium]|nr:helix-turn-helix domain-containing protein [Rhizobiaceae bacterium]